MKIKQALLIFIVVCFLVSIAGVSATENATSNIISHETNLDDYEYLGDADDSKSFDDLRSKIDCQSKNIQKQCKNQKILSNFKNKQK